MHNSIFFFFCLYIILAKNSSSSNESLEKHRMKKEKSVLQGNSVILENHPKFLPESVLSNGIIKENNQISQNIELIKDNQIANQDVTIKEKKSDENLRNQKNENVLLDNNSHLNSNQKETVSSEKVLVPIQKVKEIKENEPEIKTDIVKNPLNSNEEETFWTKLKSNFVLFMSIIAIKINEIIYLNPSINNQTPNNLDTNSKIIAFTGFITVIIVFLFLWRKVFRFQNTKEKDNENNIVIIKKRSNNLDVNKESKITATKEITLPNGENETKNEINSDESNILLKGRTKKIPRSINYNELFVNQMGVKQEPKSRKNCEKNQNNNYFNGYEEKKDDNSNFEDFFDKINQNKKVLEILNQETEKLNLNSHTQKQNVNNYVTSGVDLWETEKKNDQLNNLLLNLTEKKNNNTNFIPISQNNNCPIAQPKDSSESLEILNTTQQNKSFSDTKERLMHNNLLSKTPLSKIFKQTKNH